jgi:CheY-like chemotaxis protein
LDGEIHVESRLGKGSLFTIHLPQKTINTNIIGAGIADSLRNFKFVYDKGRERRSYVRDVMPYGKVLVVDDVETNRFVAEGLLRAYKLGIELASSGHEAIKKIEDGYDYDIILMDHMMPGMNGMETRKRMREMGYAKPIVALTANVIADQADVFLKNGFDGFLSKPVDVRQLDAVLNKFIRDKQPPEVIEGIRKQQRKIGSSMKESKSELIEPIIDLFSNANNLGLDLSNMLKRYDNNVSIIIRILRSYTQDVRSLLMKINNTDEIPLSEYEIMMHGIKAASHAIYADETAKMAEGLEKAAISDDSDYINDHNRAFIENTHELINNLDRLLDALDEADPKPT